MKLCVRPMRFWELLLPYMRCHPGQVPTSPTSPLLSFPSRINKVFLNWFEHLTISAARKEIKVAFCHIGHGKCWVKKHRKPLWSSGRCGLTEASLPLQFEGPSLTRRPCVLSHWYMCSQLHSSLSQLSGWANNPDLHIAPKTTKLSDSDST